MASVAVDALLEYIESSNVVSLVKNDNLSTILESLRFLRAFLEDPPQQFVSNGKLADLEYMANEAASIISSFDFKKMDEDIAQELTRRLLGLVHKIEQVKKEGKKVYDQMEKPPRSNFPANEDVDFIDYVVENLRELLKRKETSVALLKHQIATVVDLLPSLKAHCVMGIEELDEDEELSGTEIEELHKRNEEFEDRRTRIMGVAYEIEYVTDCSICGVGSTWCHKFWLDEILEEIGLIKKATVRIYDKVSVIEHLISGLEQLEVASILDVPATTMAATAEEIYNDFYVINHFDVRGRCVIPPSYEKDKRKVLLDVRSSLMKGEEEYKLDGEVSKMSASDIELAQELCKSLSGFRCLIVMEDMRDIQFLVDLKKILGNCRKGSKILLITRSAEVAFKASFTHVVKMDSELLANRFELLIPQYLNAAKRSSHQSSETRHSVKDEPVIGLDGMIQDLCDVLVSGPPHLQVISVFGMGGTGKTTLASKLYNDGFLQIFDVKAWCVVSQEYETRNLLLQLLHSVNKGLTDDYRGRSEEDLAAMLRKLLWGRRYFIVLDDVWDSEAWHELRICFPDDSISGSRILLTTRLRYLAAESNYTYRLQLLSLSDSWELFQSKVFGAEGCPPELRRIGMEIVRSCGGLPLLVLLIAGILNTMEKKVDQWKQVEEILNSVVLDDVEGAGTSLMEFSYKYLPDHLKSCFLYFGGFPEDKIIPVSKLIRLWIAEGLVPNSDFKCLEDIAENYLMDLIRRNLVTVAEVSSKGGVKSCRVHDIIHEFCLKKAKDTKFWQHVYGQHVLSDIYDRRWLSICKTKNFFMSKPSGPRVRSLLFFASSDYQPRYAYDFSFMSENFKLLRVLDFEDINVRDSFEAICRLVLLRYLAVQCETNPIPSSIANLLNLESFLVEGLRGEVTIPASIWAMKRLRHLRIRNGVLFSLHKHRFGSFLLLENLQTLSTTSLSYGDDMEKILRRLPRLRKLRCIFLDSLDHSRNCNQFPSLDFLSNLESLNVVYGGDAYKYPCKFVFPPNLKKLTLSNFYMPWNEMSNLATLMYNLEVLKLLNDAFVGQVWEMEDECFPMLKMLKLDRLNIARWDACYENFPCLERLTVYSCEQLEEIPPSIRESLDPKTIEVKWCNLSAASSAHS